MTDKNGEEESGRAVELGTDDDAGPPARGGGGDAVRQASTSSLSRRRGLVKQVSDFHLGQTANLGDANIERTRSIGIRIDDERGAMTNLDRRKKQLRNFLCLGRAVEAEKKTSENAKPQFTVNKKQMFAGNCLVQKLRGLRNFLCFSGSVGLYDAGSSGGFPSLSRAIVNHLDWLFRTSFIVFFAYSALHYYVGVLFFTGLITIAGKVDDRCVRIGDNRFGLMSTEFFDAFTLSWTTFSTVGYGSVYPALAKNEDRSVDCTGISFICVIEAFIGILYAAFVGSILFGKIFKIQSRAQVLFSDPLLVRYGGGVTNDLGEEDEDEDEEEKASVGADASNPQQKYSTIPCPVLEFRIANRLHDEMGGEIMDANLNVVASLDVEEVHPDFRKKIESPPAQIAQSFIPQSSLDTPSSSVHSTTTDGSDYTEQDRQTVEEDPTHSLAPIRIFSKLLIEASDHPFFKRVWLVRHVLDGTSPLLTAKARRLVQKNKGHWPEQLNKPEEVRKNIHFNQILVSLNGVSNVSGTPVYAQKIYDHVDLAVGYQFVDILYRGSDDNLKVDLDLINDVREQNGGGGEDIMNR